MSEWGLNPSTVQAIGAALTFFTLVGVVLATIQAKRSADAAEKGVEAAQATARSAEQSAEILAQDAEPRRRPWVGLVDCVFRPDVDPKMPGLDEIEIKYQNIGLLPAGNTSISIQLNIKDEDAVKVPDGFNSNFPMSAKSVAGPMTVFPREPSEYHAKFSDLYRWRFHNIPVTFNGIFEYYYGESHYLTEFAGQLEFTNQELSLLNWLNERAT